MAEQTRISFYDQIARNKFKSFMLIFIIILVIIALGFVIGQIYAGYFWFILVIAIIFSTVYTIIGYYGCAKMAIIGASAKPADPRVYRQYYNLVEGLTIASGLPMPKLYIMENSQINAFASGRDPKHAIMCVTTGAIEKLKREELEGVLAHELSHIANFDIRFMTLTAVLVGMIAIISEIFLRSLWFRSGGSDRDNKGAAIFMIIGIVLAILAPIFVQLVQLAISRKREYTADASAVKFTRTTTGLIGALKKIKDSEISKNETKGISKAVAPLFLSNPFGSEILSTHPALEKRIQILERM